MHPDIQTSTPALDDCQLDAEPRSAHRHCPWCYPDPQLGDTVTALCGKEIHFLGHLPEDAPLPDCPYCEALAPVVSTAYRCPRCA
jgi:hypothetical protein